MVTNSSGSVVAEYSFDSWGRRRDPADWSKYKSFTIPDILIRGYTGHEMLDEVGLVNMNARLYDPVLGRMLQTDNYVQAPDNVQNFNRYAYCLNNPIKYNDPTGEIANLWTGLIGAAIFGVGNLAVQTMNGEISNFRDAATAFGSGATAGFLLGSGLGALSAIPFASGVMLTAAIGYGGTTLVGGIVGGIQGAATGDWSKLENAGRIFMGNFYLDKNRIFGGQVLQGTSRFSWELPQSVAGHGYAQLRNTLGHVHRVDYLGGATYSQRIRPEARFSKGVSMGSHINVVRTDDAFDIANDPLLMHEYGHTFDSQIFGITYALAIMIPSGVATDLWDYQVRGEPSGVYHSDFFYTEKWANRHAARYFGNHYGVDWNSRYQEGTIETYYPRRNR